MSNASSPGFSSNRQGHTVYTSFIYIENICVRYLMCTFKSNQGRKMRNINCQHIGGVLQCFPSSEDSSTNTLWHPVQILSAGTKALFQWSEMSAADEAALHRRSTMQRINYRTGSKASRCLQKNRMQWFRFKVYCAELAGDATTFNHFSEMHCGKRRTTWSKQRTQTR